MNLSKKKNEMPSQAPFERIKNFDEVALGYTFEMALDEASRCLNCKNPPCVKGCPVNINIPRFISKIKEKEIKEAYDVISEYSLFPSICGRVCPQETQCEAQCVRGKAGEPVGIGYLERFVADYVYENKSKRSIIKEKDNNIKVAVVGSGPAGLTCASELARRGYRVTIFEALHAAGGVLAYGIPEFRLPKKILADEIERLKSLGVEILTNVIIGKSLTIEDIFSDGYKAVYLGTGAGLPKFMKIPGENANGVFSANEFLTRINLMKAYKEGYETPIYRANKVAVVGGGNVAMDAARCAKRLGANEVYIIYRRSEKEMPARLEEVHHAKEEGIKFMLLSNPTEIVAENGKVVGIKCVKMELKETDSKGRMTPVEIKDSEFFTKVDAVIMALGNHPNPVLTKTTDNLEVDSRGCLIVDENYQTSRKGIFAGGDAVTGAATVISAMGAGKVAAKNIDEYLKNSK
ncbi:MAG: NADPH-dependent glutamate synthase [Bacilli bacterium]|jgi:glutamate synthase (NADPH/NADH) small chain